MDEEEHKNYLVEEEKKVNLDEKEQKVYCLSTLKLSQIVLSREKAREREREPKNPGIETLKNK